jgi:hypothetical protein
MRRRAASLATRHRCGSYATQASNPRRADLRLAGLLLTSCASLGQVAEEWKEREGARKQDHLEAWILQLSTLLGEHETVERGLHGLWELACRPSNHAEIPVDTVDELVRA